MNIACYSVIALLPNKKMLISTLKVMSGGKKKLIKSADEFKELNILALCSKREKIIM